MKMVQFVNTVLPNIQPGDRRVLPDHVADEMVASGVATDLPEDQQAGFRPDPVGSRMAPIAAAVTRVVDHVKRQRDARRAAP